MDGEKRLVNKHLVGTPTEWLGPGKERRERSWDSMRWPKCDYLGRRGTSYFLSPGREDPRIIRRITRFPEGDGEGKGDP